MAVLIRRETDADVAAIRTVTDAAFRGMTYASGTEAAIVEALRSAGALALSLVAEEGGRVIGHVAFSPVTVDGQDIGWLGLGPLSVEPAMQGAGVGTALVGEGLAQLRLAGIAGCVVLGDPAYYGRFGFMAGPRLRYGNAPPEFFQGLSFTGAMPAGSVAFHAAFDTAA